MRIFLQFLGTLKCLWNVSLFTIFSTLSTSLPVSICARCFWSLLHIYKMNVPLSTNPANLLQKYVWLKAILIFAHGSNSKWNISNAFVPSEPAKVYVFISSRLATPWNRTTPALIHGEASVKISRANKHRARTTATASTHFHNENNWKRNETIRIFHFGYIK